MGDNIFDDDDCLDHILYEDSEKDGNNKGSGGCLGLFLLMAISSASVISLGAYLS